jgi:hypothetical protein
MTKCFLDKIDEESFAVLTGWFRGLVNLEPSENHFDSKD